MSNVSHAGMSQWTDPWESPSAPSSHPRWGFAPEKLFGKLIFATWASEATAGGRNPVVGQFEKTVTTRRPLMSRQATVVFAVALAYANAPNCLPATWA